jgi:hypothetical protein
MELNMDNKQSAPTAPSIVALNERLSALSQDTATYEDKMDKYRAFIADVIGYRSGALRYVVNPPVSVSDKTVVESRIYVNRCNVLIHRAMEALRHNWEYAYPETIIKDDSILMLQSVQGSVAHYVTPDKWTGTITDNSYSNTERVAREIVTNARVRDEIDTLELCGRDPVTETPL